MLRRLITAIGGVTLAATALVSVAPVATAAPTAKGSTYLALDDTAAAALAGLGVTPGLVAPSYVSGGKFAMPVVGRYPAPVIKHVGGLSLSSEDVTVTLTNFWIDTTTGLVSGEVNSAFRADLFSIVGAGPNGSVALGLTQAAADALNGAFATDAFVQGFVVAYAWPAPKAANS